MIGSNFDTPIMYQDLATSTMPPMTSFGMYGGMYGGVPHLYGIKLPPNLNKDKVELMHKKDEECKSSVKKALIAIAICFGVGFIPTLRKSIKNAGGIGKFIKNQWNNLVNWVKGTNTQQTQKQGWWQKLKNKFKKNPTSQNNP